MRGAKSEGTRIAKGIVVVSRRAAIRGASSARGIVIMSSVSGGGGVLWVNEWTSMGLVGIRHACTC